MAETLKNERGGGDFRRPRGGTSKESKWLEQDHGREMRGSEGAYRTKTYARFAIQALPAVGSGAGSMALRESLMRPLSSMLMTLTVTTSPTLTCSVTFLT